MTTPNKPNVAKEAGKLATYCTPIFAAGVVAATYAEPKIIGAAIITGALGLAWSGAQNIHSRVKEANEQEAEQTATLNNNNAPNFS